MSQSSQNHVIMCRVDTIDSLGALTICGCDGYRLERDGFPKCNVFWLYGNDKILPMDRELSVDAESSEFQLLLTAKKLNAKIELKVNFVNQNATVKSVKIL